MSDRNHPDIAALRERLENLNGPEYWRSLQELAETEAFQDAVKHEFPEGADTWDDPTGRRRFLRVMSASLALAGVGLSGCIRRPDDQILPYVNQQEGIVPGQSNFFATSFVLAGYAQGVLAESQMGRPIKIEGNPDHPASRGSTNPFMQASVLDLYDPDRSENVRHQGGISTWPAFVQAMQAEQDRWAATQGRGLRVLTGTVTSPTLAAQLQTLLDTYPAAQWHQYEPTTHDAEREGIRQTRGRYEQAVYHFDEADAILSLDENFLLERPGSIRYARDFSDGRRVREDQTAMNRLYMAESSFTITGSMADHRLPARPSVIEAIARATAQAMGLDAGGAVDLPPEQAEWAEAIAQDLQTHAGSALVVAGPTMPPAIHALVHRMNEVLGAVGTTVTYIDPAEARPENHHASLTRLVEDMDAGDVETLVILGGNPSYTAPADVPFAEALTNVPTSVHLSLAVDETSRDCVWHVPRQHYLECWSDARAFDGTASIIQPLIAPIVEGARSEHDILALLNGTPGSSSYDTVRTYWQEQFAGEAFERFWERALQSGTVPGTGLDADESPRRVRVGAIWLDEAGMGPAPETLRLQTESAPADAESAPADATAAPAPSPAEIPTPPTEDDVNTVTVVFRPDPSIWDGRFANNGWLQELPKPLTKLVWDNALLIAPRTAERFDLQTGDVVELHHRENVVRAPVWILPGHPEGTATAYLGYGRTATGRVGSGAGFNAYALRSVQTPWALSGVTLRKTGETYDLVSTQDHFSMEGREPVRNTTIERFREEPEVIHDGHPLALPSLYPEWEYPDRRWGMGIDTNVCIGCNACVVACQAENNIPVVGKEAVANGREMHWLLVDRYFQGALDNPNTFFQPRPCMHCEKAPCEVVCPVYATVHDHEGLNVMVYNRCIGTRYCSNNCPYKVRRFNFLEWNDWNPTRTDLQHNPEVTVRSRGVMEKCTYCQQRINQARIRADRDDRPIRDGEVMTACQQACPTHAIVFGDINDETEVRRWKEQPHDYGLLAELGTQPRTTYLAHFDNPNAAMPVLQQAGPSIGQEEEIEVEVGPDYEGAGEE